MTFEASPPNRPHITLISGTWVAQDKRGFAIGYGPSPVLAGLQWKANAKVMQRWINTEDKLRQLSSSSFREYPGTRHGGT